MTKGELKWSTYKKVPLVVVDGKQINDSTVIITEVSRAFLRVEGLKG